MELARTSEKLVCNCQGISGTAEDITNLRVVEEKYSELEGVGRRLEDNLDYRS